jgi:hypothetical protein
MTLYNPEEQNKPYESIRFTVTNPILVEALNDHFVRTGKSTDRVAKDALRDFLEEEVLEIDLSQN